MKDEKGIFEQIKEIKQKMGPRLLILGHHYQSESVIQFADLRGDSFLLSRQASRAGEAEYIVFLGVNFMAETADILTGPEKAVVIPSMDAGCPMADMAPIDEVEYCWEQVQKFFPGEVVPVTYVNSLAEVKAFCGRHGGLTCTSSSAGAAFKWAFKRNKRILFFPDKYLGMNTSAGLGIEEGEISLWDRQQGVLTGSENPKIILWDGYCPVHIKFTPHHAAKAREQYPGIKITVHPECPRETVIAADESGSTEEIIKYIENSPPGSVRAVGTEINMVERLAGEHSDKTIVSLAPEVEACEDMMKITPSNLLWCLKNIYNGNLVNRVEVGEETAYWAEKALHRMLETG